eukprot:NODE_5025_length_731_cov_106.562914_g5002_i0.p1 GENE.NODE_5025_length_731_cov_106.562914_g5002_i0~~NODE_5025_length_731_cov_106.562914_g5002_i0.p1  ORF type:complete len:228 (+),score=32.69 NODE_5025_length_731_cov_106.562914_g5002_i0:73-684(+)
MARFGVLVCFACIVTEAALPKPVWPQQFHATFDETTWNGTQSAVKQGQVWYKWANTTQVIVRADGTVNPLCKTVKPGLHDSCVMHSLNTDERYIYYPNQQFCCKYCTKDCGTLTPEWVTAVPYLYAGWREIAGKKCNMWTLSSNTPDRLGTSVEDGSLCELYDGGADYPGDGAWQWAVTSYSNSVPDSALQLPEYCAGVSSCH